MIEQRYETHAEARLRRKLLCGSWNAKGASDQRAPAGQGLELERKECCWSDRSKQRRKQRECARPAAVKNTERVSETHAARLRVSCANFSTDK